MNEDVKKDEISKKISEAQQCFVLDWKKQDVITNLTKHPVLKEIMVTDDVEKDEMFKYLVRQQCFVLDSKKRDVIINLSKNSICNQIIEGI